MRKVICAWVGMGLFAGAVRADVGELVDRLPAQANAIVAVDVAPIRAAARRDSDAPRSSAPLPPVANLQELLLAAHVQTSTLEPVWEVAVLCQVLDSFTGGSSLADSSAAWLNRNARRIDQMQADNVDPELLLWGAEVSSKTQGDGRNVFLCGKRERC